MILPATDLDDGSYRHFLTNSVLAVGISTVLAFVIGGPAAFTLAYYPGRRARNIVLWVLSTRFMPAVAVAVPVYVLFNQAGLRDTVAGLVLIYTYFDERDRRATVGQAVRRSNRYRGACCVARGGDRPGRSGRPRTPTALARPAPGAGPFGP